MISYGIRRGVRAQTVCLCEDVGVSFDQVVVGSGKAVSELRRSGSFGDALLNAHVQGVGMSELEGGEFSC